MVNPIEIARNLREYANRATARGTNHGVNDLNAAALIEAQQSEIERLTADVEQLRINLDHARTGRALRDLKRERADHEAIVRSLCRSLARAVMEARDLREQNAELLAQRATPRQPDITIDVGIGTAIDIIRDINRHLDNIEALTLNREDRNDPTEP